MSRRKKNNKDQDLFLRYAGDGIKGKERNTFERRLQKDQFEAEAAEGFSMISPEEAKEDLRFLDERLKMRTAKRRSPYLLRIAALFALLVATSLVLVIFRPEKQAVVTENIPAQKEKTPLTIKPAEPITRALEESKSGAIVTTEKRQTVPVRAEQQVNVVVPEIAAEAEVGDVAGIRADISKEAVPEVIAYAPARSKASVLQVRKISGTVISTEDHQPIPGVVVALQGKVSGVTVSDVNGNFSFDAKADSSLKLIASFVGMKTTEITAARDTGLLIAMNPDVAALDEVVVVGYGISKKQNQTGAVTTINMDEDKNTYNYISAEPATGNSAFRKYIEANIKYPSVAPEKTREVVVISMIVRTDGAIDSLKVVRSPGQEFTDEAFRLIKEGPSWTPAKLNGVPQQEEVKIRIVFK